MAEARFGADKVRVASRLDPSIPRNWGASVLAVVEASAQLTQGVAILDNENISIKGQSNIASVNSDIAGLLSEKLGTSHQYQINVTYIEPPIAPEDIVLAQDICVDRIGDILSTQKINFEPGSDRVDLAGKKILDDIAEILKSCGQIELEIAGHTDSQGREEMNRQLSQSRAQAVLFELQNRRVLTTNMVAKGYGESEPIADNASEEGREANRRIEFKLVENTGPEPSDQTQEANTDGQN
jgi:OOP family OmpA-OmpF porin